MALLKALAAKVRGILGLGGVGGLVGMVGGALWAAADVLLGSSAAPLVLEMVERALGGSISGVACGMGFGVLLVTLESKRSLEELPLWRMGLLGAVAGAMLPTIYMLVTSGTFYFINVPQIVVSVVGSGAILGAVLASTMVGVAKSAHRAELSAVKEVVSLLEAE